MFSCAQLLGSENTITGLDAATKMLTLTDGRKLQYESLISTMPLDITLTWLGKKDWADGLTHRRVPLFILLSLTLFLTAAQPSLGGWLASEH
jgi:hypothetical protein